MARYIDPTYDVGFKLLFGRENVSNEFLMDFLNSLFENDPELSNIKTVRYLNSEHISEWKDGKTIRYDILCETSTGHKFIVEMQKAWQANFIKRAVFYVCRGIAEQGYRGKNEDEESWEYAITPVVGVFICNFRLRELGDKVVTRVRPMDEDTLQPVSDLTRYVVIQLPLFDKKAVECDKIVDQWIYNLKNMGAMQEVAFKSHRDVFERLANVGNVATLTPAERYVYEADIKKARDYRCELKGAHIQGFEQGLEEGRAEGLTEGRVEGLRMAALKLRQSGMDIESIERILAVSYTPL
ncbi:MAG: Rpn family recombination-promoting nuclease/putative transposase, partial [Muribaculaceae bacterium]|nr:Rpn family recombination-promoting nuclease/putative transposase [Muribaculaceae bacterium]